MRTVAKRLVRISVSILCLWIFAVSFRGDGAPWLSVSAASNPIVVENALPGTPANEWNIVGAGDPSIQGFATEISVNKGQTVSFKIKTDSTNYHIDIYRLGYYNGAGARKMTPDSIAITQAQAQPPCLTDDETGLIDCGNWSVLKDANGNPLTAWTVPPDATSGIYIAKLTRIDGIPGSSHIVFVVRDDGGASNVLFQTSDETWQAYNSYGGNSLYTGQPGTNPGRAYKVSYNRPFNTREDSPEDWLFNAEYPMVRWLEANGYDVSYYTGVDAERFGAAPSGQGGIRGHKVYLSVGHDEYWSGNQRKNVEAARDAGVHLAFFSGNEIFWKTRFEDSTAGSPAAYRTLVSYKETHANAKIDPLPDVWTGTWRDPRFSPPADGGRPENSLSGTIFMVNDGGDSNAAITVSSAFSRFWLWKNTAVETLPSGQSLPLANGTLGYEWDEDLDIDTRPAGLIRLSSTTLSSVPVLTDYGSTYVPGSATHNLTLYRRPGGALVFGAGTVQWSWGLDGTHDRGGSLASLTMQQATVNLLANMSAQPATLQPGLQAATASLDTAAPTSAITSPQGGASVVVGSAIAITGTASDAGGGVVGAVEVSTDGGLTWHRAEGRETWTYAWIPGSTGSATLRSRAVDDSGNLETPAAGITVTMTADDGGTGVNGDTTVAPGISIWDPTFVPARADFNDGAPIELGVKFRSDLAGSIVGLRFYKAGADSGAHVGHLWSASGGLLATVQFPAGDSTAGWREATLPTPVAIDANHTYIASHYSPVGFYAFDGGYFNGKGFDHGVLHALADGVDGPNGAFHFGSSGFPTSGGGANYWVDIVFNDTTPPSVSRTLPEAGSEGAAPGAPLTVTFSETMAAASISAATVHLRDAANVPLSGNVSYDAATRRAIFVPVVALSSSTTYTATVDGGSGGVTDVAGNPITSSFVWSFTTGAPPLSSPNQGPGGPILVVNSDTNPFTRYYAEILRAEGLNEFAVADISTVSGGTLAAYDVVILGEVPLTTAQVAMFSTWVTSGGNLICMRPDPQLAGLLGLTAQSSTLADGYIRVDASTAPGAGIVSDTIQFHGTADKYTAAGATTVATLYSDAMTATANPAVTLRTVGAGHAAAFAFDLARSIVQTRQGNPAWAGQERDGLIPIRSDDLFFGNAAADPKPDWVDLDKVAIPQADEQQRLLANLILVTNGAKKPLPRSWYLPRGHKAAVVMTGDDHARNGTATRFEGYIANSLAGCSIDDWECVRSTSYMYANTPLTTPQAISYDSLGFELALHVTTGCSDYTSGTLENFYATQLAQWQISYPGLPAPTTNRTHCVVWSDWATQPKADLAHGIRLDTTYYSWPVSWILDRPGMFTGSGIPMRFTDTDGSIIDVYQAATQMNDESEQSYPKHVDELLDRATGPQGYYGAFVANMHNDTNDAGTASIVGSNAIIASAQAHGVPVISAKQLLQWIDGRNSSRFDSIAWSGGHLTFTMHVGVGGNGIQVMLPSTSSEGLVNSIVHNGQPLTIAKQVIKGIEYAIFPGGDGSYDVTYGTHVDSISQTIAFGVLANHTFGDAPFTLSATATSGLAVSYSIVSGPATISGSKVTLTGAGTVTVRASQAGDDTYAPAPDVDRSFTVSKAPLTVTAENQTKIYGAVNPVLTSTLTGFVNGDTAAVVSGSAALSTTATTGSPVVAGGYPITAALGTLAAANYSFTFSNGTLTVMPAALTVTATNQTKIYGAANPALTATATGLVGNDTLAALTLGYTLSTTASTTSGVGSYPITLTGGATSAANYGPIVYTAGTLTVTRAPLTVTATDQTKIYGAANPVLTATATGLVGNDTLAALTLGYTLSTTASATSGAGSYPITMTGGATSAANYGPIVYTAGTLTVTRAPLTVTANDQTKIYGAANPAFTAAYSGFVNGDTAAVVSGSAALSTTATPGSPVVAGGYPITAAQGNLAAANYSFAFRNGTLTVMPAVLTVTADNQTKTSGAVNPPLTVRYSGFVNGDTATSLTIPVAVSTTATVASPVGTYPITASGAVGANYTIVYVSGTLTVTPAAPATVITWDNPAAVSLNTALSYIQLNATANTSGTFVYNPPLGTVLNVAGPKTLSVTFNPTDTVRYSTVAKSVQINVVAPGTQTMTSTLTVSTPSVQYSDVASFSVSVTSSLAGQAPAGKVAFKIGTQAIGVANLTPVGNAATATTYQAVWSGPLLEPSPAGTPPTGQMRPSLKVLGAVMLDPDTRFVMANPANKSMTIKLEDAGLAYTGATTLSLGTGTTVPLTALVTNLDAFPGDLSLATVQFVNKATGTLIGTAAVGADGKATVMWTAPVGTYSIGYAIGGNYYVRNNPADVVSVTVTK